MPGVNIPQKKPSGLGDALTIGGAVAGSLIAPVGGTVVGAAAGAGAGQIAGGILSPAQPEQPALQTDSSASAMQRRTQQMSQDRLAILRESEKALTQLPEPLRRQYTPALVQARMMEEQKRFNGGQ